MLREVPGYVVAAHVRQIEVYKQDRGHELGGEGKSSRSAVRDARLTVAQLETRSFTLDVQLVRALGGGFAAA